MAVVSAFITNFASVFAEVPIAAFTQEIMVMTAFLISFWSWRYFKSKPSSKHKPAAADDAYPLKKVGVRSSCAADSKFARSPSTRSQSSVKTQAGAPPGPLVSPAVIQAAQKQMLQHLEQREFTRALNMYRAMEKDGRDQYLSEELFAAFVQSAIRVGKADVVERMIRTMKRNGIHPSLSFWQTTLRMLSSRKYFSVCLAVHAVYGKQIPTDKVVFSCLINASLEAGVPEKAMSLLECYSEAGIDYKDYVLFFRTYVALGDADSAEACFRKLGPETTTLMLNLLLLTCVQAGDTERAHRLLQEAHVFAEEKKKIRKINDTEDELIVDTVSYNTIIKGYGKSGSHTKCFDCLHEMLARGLEPDDVTFGTLLDACIVDNHLGAANEVVNLLIGRDKPMDTVMGTLFMKGLVRVNCLPKALELYDEMKNREGGHPDIVTYSVLIKALVDNKDLDRALRLLQDMAEAGLKPDDIILTHLLEGCRLLGNHTLGKKLFEDMLAFGVKPSEFTLVTMLKLHGRAGAHREAHELVMNWEERFGEKPSVIHYTCIMSGCLRTKKYDQAWEAYELMCEKGVKPDQTTISTLLPGLVVAQQWNRVLTIVRRGLSGDTPVQIPTETLNSALSQMRACQGASRSADQLQELMVTAGVVMTARNSKRAS